MLYTHTLRWNSCKMYCNNIYVYSTPCAFIYVCNTAFVYRCSTGVNLFYQSNINFILYISVKGCHFLLLPLDRVCDAWVCLCCTAFTTRQCFITFCVVKKQKNLTMKLLTNQIHPNQQFKQMTSASRHICGFVGNASTVQQQYILRNCNNRPIMFTSCSS